jgi:LPS-assembly protein
VIRFEIRREMLITVRLACLFSIVVGVSGARAQQPSGPPGQPPGLPTAAPKPAAPAGQQPATIKSDLREVKSDELEIHKGNFEYQQGDTRMYADNAEFFLKQHRLLLTGNVSLAQGDGQISADRADFNTETKIGIFYNARGIANIKPPKQQIRPGAPAPPPVSNQPTDVYFFGDTVEKIGPRKYRITNGGFTTCVQPTPRWDLHADTVVLNVDHYTLLKNAVLTVKGVPMLYVPLMYYPTKREDRATGFLLPTYGSSTLRGQQIHNAFFWAIDRSQDATIQHEWYSKVGQGVAGEYRYNFGGGDDGSLTTHFLDQHATTYDLDDGTTQPVAASRSYDLRGGLNQALPGGFRARASVDYFSSLTVNQTYNSSVYNASSNMRNFGGNIAGSIAGYTINATANRNEYFTDANDSSVIGSGPQVDIARTERPLFGSQVYFAVNAQYARLLSENKGITTVEDTATPFDIDQGLTRLDVTPQIRYPFKKWQWFTVNSTFSWRDTYYTRSEEGAAAVPTTNPNGVVDTAVNRRFFTAQAQITGPVFNRIWDTPGNGFAEKFKHSIEPYLTIARTSSIDNYNNIVKIDSVDTIIGGNTSFVYGLTNRFFAKRHPAAGRPAVSSEILDVQLEQTYYTEAAAAAVDPRYATSFTTLPTDTTAATNFSPIALTVRAIPTNELNASIRAEFDSRYHSLRTVSLTASYSLTSLLTTTVQWSKKALIQQLAGFNDPAFLDHYISATTNVHTRDSRYGTAYQFNYDVLHSAMLQQKISGYYNAQCCGLAFEYQTFNYNFGAGSSLPADHRFFLSFTLAGLGNFSPFNGAMSGAPR